MEKKKFFLEVDTTISFSTHKVDCEEEHDMDYENPEIRIITQEVCDRWNKEKFLLDDKRTKWEPHKMVTIKCKNCDYEENKYFSLRKDCEPGTHKWGKPYGPKIKSLDGNYYNRRVNCVNCDKYNYVDDDGNLELKNI